MTNTNHQTFDDRVVLSRQSPLRVRPPGPDSKALDAMLRSAMCAPDHGKLKPWRFIVIADDALNAFGDVLGEALARRDPAATEDAIARERAKALRAPLILVVVAKVAERHSIPSVEQIIATGIAANNVLLTAFSLGYGGMWRTGVAAYDEHVRHALGLGNTDSIVGFLYLGTPDVMPPPRTIPSVDDFVRHWEGVQLPQARVQGSGAPTEADQ